MTVRFRSNAGVSSLLEHGRGLAVLRRTRGLARAGALSLALVAASLLITGSAGAVGTRTFELDTLDELSGGDLKGVSVSSDGTVRAGWTFGSTQLEGATAAFSILPLADGSTLVGTSPNGKVFKVAGDHATVFAETGALAVTSMVEGANGTVYAASIPDGTIFKLSGGKAEVFAKLPDVSHVWALAFDRGKTALYAATGGSLGGRVFRVDLSGNAQVHFKSDEPQLVSLAVAESGDVYAGSSGKGILYRITGPGRATVLYDFPGEEVKAVAVGKNNTVFAISNDYGEPPDPPQRNPRAPAGPASTTARPKPGKGTLTRFDSQGRPERLMHNDEFHYMALAVGDGDRAYVGTGAEGRVYMVDADHVVSLVADSDERQVGAIAFGKAGPVFAGSDNASFHRVLGQGGADAVWTSKSFDAGLRAKFGRLSWTASGPVELSTRTGNTQAPDSTWSEWSAYLGQSGPITSPVSRFVQVRARFARDPRAILSSVSIPFVTENTRPVVTDIDAAQKGAIRETKEGLTASGEAPKRESVVHITWKVENGDNDALRYRLNYRRDGQGQWRDVLRDGEIVTKNEYDWEIQALPEGKYRLRVEASDEMANPPEQVQRHALESAPVLVDNTPPVITQLTLDGRRLRGRVVDGLGPVARVEVAIDGHLEWRPLSPADGVFDSADEAIDADVGALVPAGSHIVTVRAYDAAGNTVMRELESR